MNENFIRTYKDVLDANLINTLLQMIDQQVVYTTVNDKHRQDKQLALDPYWPSVAMDINTRPYCATLYEGTGKGY